LQLAAGAAADAVLGDPARLHPVAGFGRLATELERVTWRPSRAAGALHVAVLAGACALVGRRLPGAVAVWLVLGGRSLDRAALALADALERSELEEARRLARALVGRDPAHLDAAELARAAVESVAENTGDAVVAPLLWFAVAGVPGALVYRAVNTLDAMIGHKTPRYREFGWTAARLDDLVNWPAARLGAVLAVCLAADPREAARVLVRDGAAHPSPNAGRLEAAFAGALSLRLGGANIYEGRVEVRPSLGDGTAPTPADVRRAVELSRAVGAAALACCLLFATELRR
jgi:adenosylcobinamide-phosphate synthase